MKLKLVLCFLACIMLLPMFGCDSKKNDQNVFWEDMLGVKFHENDEWGLDDETVPQYNEVEKITTEGAIPISNSDMKKLESLLQDRSRWHPGCLKIRCHYTLQTSGGTLEYSDEYGYIQDWDEDLHLCLTREEALWLNSVLYGETPIYQEESFWIGATAGVAVAVVSCVVIAVVVFRKKSNRKSTESVE